MGAGDIDRSIVGRELRERMQLIERMAHALASPRLPSVRRRGAGLGRQRMDALRMRA